MHSVHMYKETVENAPLMVQQNIEAEALIVQYSGDSTE